ncbi:DNA polymerase III subunit gamma/tau [Candidatus Clavichlamydia salmonicola]|uniref:DNA polymerase III subunit gamma/tau n=1 Tax=Candidatus Clavichlamydia salmonicola TaxID=469812 RepID=UPI001891E59F|nr:DNA polymerase III subunit gamma/tau [Candidatus Clavichlamydia salmonicola]
MSLYSSSYLASSRRYRPQRFADIVGQESVVRILTNAILSNSSSHAYIFSGCHGTGKTTLARILAKALNCQDSHKGEPCNLCASCKEIAAFSSMDVLEIDGASHRGVEDIRQINDSLAFAPIQTRFKIYIIDEVHMLTKEAFNALLKTLEDPPIHVKFFLATTEPHKIPETILSRCQQLRLQRIAEEKIAGKLTFIAKESQLDHDKDALLLLAKLAEGSMRNAESLFDQVLAFSNGKIDQKTVRTALSLPEETLFFDLDEAILSQKIPYAFKIAQTVFSCGINPIFFIEELSDHFRALLLTRNGVKVPLSLSPNYYKKIAPQYKEDEILRILQILSEAAQKIKLSSFEKSFIETLLLHIISIRNRPDLNQLLNKVLHLEKTLASLSVKSLSCNPSQTSSSSNISVEKEKIESQEDLNIVEKRTIPNPAPTPSEKEESAKEKPSIKEMSRIDTLMQFAAKELNGILKKI